MTHLERMIAAFPRGRGTQELFDTLGCRHDPLKRRALQAEVARLAETGRIVLGPDRRWRTATQYSEPAPFGSAPDDASTDADATLSAIPARFCQETLSARPLVDEDRESGPDPAALLRYYASALRADPRGALVQAPDRHGVQFQLVTGRGAWWTEDDTTGVIVVDLEVVPAAFREALSRREGIENALAIGWPIAVGRRSGAPAIWPVGLLAARWKRADGALRIEVQTTGLVANPAWVKAAARNSAWTESALGALFAGDGSGGAGIALATFAERVGEAMASVVHGRLTGTAPVASIRAGGGAIFDAMGLFLPSEDSFTAGAARDLGAIAAWSPSRLRGTAVSALLGSAGPEHTDAPPAVNVGPINAEQLQAVENAIRASLSVVTGPPGTGKSQAIVAMAASALLRGERVLVASRNHQALDAVEERLAALAPDASFMVRTLDPRTGRDVSLVKTLEALKDAMPETAPAPDEAALLLLEEEAAARREAVALAARRAALHARLAEHLERRDARRARTADPKPSGRARGWLARLLDRLWRRQAPLAAAPETGPLPIGVDLRSLEAAIARDRDTLASLPEPCDPVALSESIAESARAVLGKRLRAMAAVPEEARLALSEAWHDLRFEGRSTPDRALVEAVLRHRPLWLASVLGTPKRLALHDAVFDLAIFDEASQCDIAAALPVMARARRAVVVGDDRQLAFIPSLSVAQDRNLMAAQGLGAKGMGRFAQGSVSLFGLARSVPNVPAVMLREQYRSAPEIVAYLNGAFYGGRLKVAADVAGLRVPSGSKPGLAWTDVPGAAGPGERGQNVNAAEAKAIAAHLADLLGPRGYEGSVGVVAPFRAQVAMLAQAIDARVDAAARERADLRVGTVDGFQGQERDLILFSPTVFAGSPSSGHTFYQRDWRRLNVAISRARAVAHVFGDLSFARSGRIRVLATLAARATEPPRRGGESVFDSEWERVLDAALRRRGLEPHPQYEIAGRRLDFALFGRDGVSLDLEVDGRRFHQDPDGRRKIDDHWRDHQLTSLGWRVRRFWVDELDRDLEGCLDLIERDLA